MNIKLHVQISINESIMGIHPTVLNQSFETGGRTVFKVGGGFEILPEFKTIKRLISKY